MSNYLSEKINYSPPPTDANFDLLAKIALMKDAKYDANKAALQEQLTKFGITDILKPEDEKYVSAKLTELTDSMNNMERGIDLSKGYVNSALSDSIMGAYKDPFVVSAIVNTRKYRNFQSEMSKIQENDLKRKDGDDPHFNKSNYDWALKNASYYDYMSGKVKDLGDFNYTPFRDVEKKQNDAVMAFEKLSKDSIVEVTDPSNPGVIRRTTKSNLSPEEIRQIVSNNIDANDEKQMQINAYYSTGEYSDPEKIKGDITTIFDSEYTNNEQKQKENQAAIDKGTLSPEEVKNAEFNVNYYKTANTDLKNNRDKLLGNVPMAATFLEKRNLINSTVNKFKSLYQENTVDVINEPYFKKKTLEIEQAKLTISAVKAQADAKKAQDDKTAPYIVTKVPTPLEDVDVRDAEITGEISRLGGTMSKTIQLFKKGVLEQAKLNTPEGKLAAVTVGKYNQNLAAGQTDEEAMKNAMLMLTNTDSTKMQKNEQGALVDFKQRFRKDYDKHSSLTIGYAKNIKDAEEFSADSTFDSQEGFTQFNADPQTKILWHDTNGKPMAVSMRKLLINNKFMKEDGTQIKQIKTAPDLYEAVKRSYYASAALGNGGMIRNKKAAMKLAESFGEKDSVVKDAVDAFGGSMNTADPNTKTGQFLVAAYKKGIYDTWASGDSSLTGDDQTTNKYIASDYKKTQKYIDGINKLAGKLGSNSAVVITTKSEDDHDLIGQIITSVASNDPKSSYVKTNPFNITLSEDGRTINISQYATVDAKHKTPIFETSVEMETFRSAAPNIASKLDFTNAKAYYTADKTQPTDLISEKIGFYNDKTSNVVANFGMKQLEGRGVHQEYLTNTGAINAITPQLVAAFGNNSAEETALENVISNASQYNITGTIDPDYNTGHNLTIYIKKNGEVVGQKVYQGVQDVDEYKNYIDNYPQVLFSEVVADIMENQVQTKIVNKKDSPQYIKLLNSLPK